MTDSRVYEILGKIEERQNKIGEDVSAIKQHLKDINGKVSCHDDDIGSLKTRVAMASGGLSTLMLVLVVLSYFGII